MFSYPQSVDNFVNKRNNQRKRFEMKKLLSYIELIRDSAEVVIERMMVNYMKSI